MFCSRQTEIIEGEYIFRLLSKRSQSALDNKQQAYVFVRQLWSFLLKISKISGEYLLHGGVLNVRQIWNDFFLITFPPKKNVRTRLNYHDRLVFIRFLEETEDDKNLFQN